MGSTSKTKIIQVSNIAPQATKDQMYSLFHYIGRIEDIRLYPTVREMSVALAARVSYIKFYDSYHTGIAQHLTNTVFIDRAIIVIPFYESEIPDETVALQKLATGTGIPGAFPPAELKLPQHIITTRHGVPPNETVITVDPVMIEQGLPPYPALPANLGSRKIEEIRRTVVAVNIHESASAEDLVELFGTAGEVKYVRLGCKPGDSTRSALVEFSEQPAVINAFKMSGTNFNETPITVGHSLQAIEKPQAKTNEAAKKEIEEAMKKVHETQHMLSSTIDPASVLRMIEKDHSFRSSRSRSRSKSRSRSRRSRSRRSRSPSSRRRKRSRSRSRSSRKRSSRSKRSRSKDRRRSRSSDRRRRRSRSRSKDKKSSKSSSRRSRDRDDKHKHDRSVSPKHKPPPKDIGGFCTKAVESPEKDASSPVKAIKDKDAEESSPTKSASPAPNDLALVPVTTKSKSRSPDPNKKDKDSSLSPARKRSPSPYRKKSRSPKPRQRSRSPKRRSRSPRRKSRSPRRKSRSPKRRKSRSPKRKSRSPRRRHSRSPPPRRRGSRSPGRRKPYRRSRSRSPKPKASSYRRRTRSPVPVRRKSKSPRRRQSPRRRSRSPRRRSPVRRQQEKPRSRSPKRRKSPSPVRRKAVGSVSRSPSPRRRQKKSASPVASRASPVHRSVSPKPDTRSRSRSVEQRPDSAGEDSESPAVQKVSKPKMKPKITISRDYDEEDRMFEEKSSEENFSKDKDDRFMFGPPGGGLMTKAGGNTAVNDDMDISNSP